MEWENARGAANRVFNDIAPGNLLSTIHQTQRIVDSAYVKLQNSETRVTALENRLDIGERWQPSFPQYQEAKQELAYRSYRRSLDELERLVVQRLFELKKLNMSDTGKS